MHRLIHVLLVLVLLVLPAQAQQPAPGAQQQQPEQPTLPRDLQLERDNLLLQARINELETQLAALKAQFIGERISQAAPALIQRLQAAAPEWTVDPQTLQMTRKQVAGVVAPAAPAPTPPTPQR